MTKLATARLQPVEHLFEETTTARTEDVLIHVRYMPSGEIFSIGERPARLDAKQWLAHLFDAASFHYQTLAGGRGFFRIPRAEFDALIGRLSA